MNSGQLRFDGRIVNTIYAEVPGFGKVALEWEGTERPKTGDRIMCGDNAYVITGETYRAKFNHDGIAKSEAEVVYNVQGVRPFRYDGFQTAAEIEAIWRQTKSSESA